MVEAATPHLTSGEHHLLDWLSKEDGNAYGECRGQAYDKLKFLGLVHTVYRDPRCDDYDRVALTEKGYALRKELGEWKP